ncbi:GntR family transcriptional regulator [Streptosporangium algeriense]|uniref:GntR family transcriptional regulator n=1 Tax=Streptosporangium algeriense TaxID=1682748 RepID=A0ABW3DVV1_9ACTN
MDVIRRSGDAVGQAYGRLREMILSGHTLPGQRLTQRELIETFDVGRTPLREALRMLEAQGFVTSTANRGITVSSINLDEAEELYAALLLLQPPLLVKGVHDISSTTLDRMAELLLAMRAVPERHYDFQHDHVEFHTLPKERFGSILQTMITGLYERLQRLQRFYFSSKKIPPYILELDEAFLQALRDGDGRRARRIQELHMLSSAIGLITDADPWHRFRALREAAAGVGIRIPATTDGTLTPPVEIVWDTPLPGYTPVRTLSVLDATPPA